MAEHWVLDASPLISLGRIGYGSWLPQLADEVVTPAAVAAEVLAGPADEARQLVATGSIAVVQAPPAPPALLAWDLGAGETAVLAYALSHPGATVILDDGPARRCARALGVPLKGTLAIVILAKQQGLTVSASAVLHQLRARGFRLDDATVAQALRATVNEPWP
ncbi:MAG: DUF3368 domain-containing protein [Fimbriimonadaceae bacterium]|nr:DUF3368 domain-containing protein [Fimbriimonadaceae bacterium]